MPESFLSVAGTIQWKARCTSPFVVLPDRWESMAPSTGGDSTYLCQIISFLALPLFTCWCLAQGPLHLHKVHVAHQMWWPKWFALSSQPCLRLCSPFQVCAIFLWCSQCCPAPQNSPCRFLRWDFQGLWHAMKPIVFHTWKSFWFMPIKEAVKKHLADFFR